MAVSLAKYITSSLDSFRLLCPSAVAELKYSFDYSAMIPCTAQRFDRVDEWLRRIHSVMMMMYPLGMHITLLSSMAKHFSLLTHYYCKFYMSYTYSPDTTILHFRR